MKNFSRSFAFTKLAVAVALLAGCEAVPPDAEAPSNDEALAHVPAIDQVVLDARTLVPVEGATVELFSPVFPGFAIASATTAASGEVELASNASPAAFYTR